MSVTYTCTILQNLVVKQFPDTFCMAKLSTLCGSTKGVSLDVSYF